jgi:hypothetical protein
MKLNHDYVRDILLFIEKELDYKDNSGFTHKEITNGQLVYDKVFSKHNKEELNYALEQLIKADYIDLASKPNIHRGSIDIADIIGLTWSGHELLDNIRNDTVWNAVKKKASKFEDFSISVLSTSAKMLVTSLMSDPNAIQNFLDGIDNIGKMFL